MADKTSIIQRICRISEEKPEFLANFSSDELLEYVRHLEQLRRPNRKKVPVGSRN